MDIKIIELDKQDNIALQSSKLMLQFSGKHVNESLVNSFRRTLFNDIPTYAFNVESIDISNNTSIFDNDEMRIRLSQITIPNINIPINYLDEEYYLISYDDPNKIKHPNDKLNIELFINAINNTENIMHVTTNDAQVYIDGEQVEKFDEKYPHLLIQLKPKQVFKMRAVANLGVGIVSNIWAGVSNAFYSDNANNEYKFTLLSLGQLHEYDLMYKACKILKHKIADIKKYLENGNINTEILKKNAIRLKLENVNYTVGGVLNEYLQINDNVTFSAITKPDHLIDEIIITIVTIKKQPLEIFYETIDYCINIYDHIETQIIKLGKQYINL
jgi:DNA-directed RNA polymerase subunit L